MTDCIFCKIIDGDIPSYTIYEDNLVKVFLDINPDCNGHCLIVPKKHTLDLSTIDNETLCYVSNIAKKISILIESKFNTDGYTLVQNNGAPQDIKHFHLHLKPHYKNKEKLLDVKEVYTKLIN